MTAETSTPINSLIAERRSPRSLNASAEISDVDLRASLEAARWAPSAFNGQPWRFFVGRRGDATFTQILSSLGEFNQMWAKNASALILVAGKDTKSDGTQHPAYLYDCGLAVAQLTLEIHDRGFVAHQMTGFDKAVAQSAVEVDAELKPVVVIAIGKQDAADKLPEAAAAREVAPRERLALEEIVIKGLPQ
jgi:nitroreductase